MIKQLPLSYITLTESFMERSNRGSSMWSEMLEMSEATNEALLLMPHPLRKKQVGVLRIDFEIAGGKHDRIYNELTKVLINTKRGIASSCSLIYDTFPEIRQQLSKHDSASTNLGSLAHILFFHKYLIMGEMLLALSPRLTEQLSTTDMNLDSSPSKLLVLPHKNFFLKTDLTTKVLNRESGFHDIEGMYINGYDLSFDDFDQSSKAAQQLQEYDLFSHCINTGVISEANGAVTILDICVTGVAKGSLLNDATLTFAFAFQRNSNKSIGEVLTVQNDYYQNCYSDDVRERLTKNGLTPQSSSKEDTDCFSAAMSQLCKVLLFLNDDNCVKEETKMVDILTRQYRNAIGKSKKRKIMNQIKDSANITIIDMPNKSH